MLFRGIGRPESESTPLTVVGIEGDPPFPPP